MLRSYFRLQGREDNEGVMLLAGRLEPGGATTLSTLALPRHSTYSGFLGCGLLIEGASFTEVGAQVSAKGARIAAIVHSHPNEAYHSQVDDRSPMMRFDGAISIVVPDFGQRASILHGAAVYRFDVEAGWQLLNRPEVSSLLAVKKAGEIDVIFPESP